MWQFLSIPAAVDVFTVCMEYTHTDEHVIWPDYQLTSMVYRMPSDCHLWPQYRVLAIWSLLSLPNAVTCSYLFGNRVQR